MILLRLPVWEPWNPNETISYADKISKRFPGVSIKYLTSRDYNHLIVNGHVDCDTQHFLFENNQQPFLNKLRNEELKQLVRQSNALYLSDESYDFRLPSHELSKSFLRVGNIQTTRGALDSLFFWLLPHLNGIEGILIDTWSISSIALNASRLLKMYKLDSNTLVRVEMLDNYLGDRTTSRQEYEEILMRISDGFQKPFLIFFSASMTGKSLQRFSSILSKLHCPRQLQKYLVLFRLGAKPIIVNNSTIPELCDFSVELSSLTKPSFQAANTEIKIDSTTYFPTFGKDKEVRLTKDIATKYKSFFNRYRDQKKAIRIHADSIIGGQKFRHHGIYIDVLQMLENPYFCSKFEQLINNLVPSPEIILVPPHDAGKKLAKIAAQQLANKNGQCPEIVDHLNLISPGDVTNYIHKKINQIDQCRALLCFGRRHDNRKQVFEAIRSNCDSLTTEDGYII